MLWSPKEKKNWNDFEKRLQVQLKRYDMWGTNYSKAYFDLKADIKPASSNNGVYWAVEKKDPAQQVEVIMEYDGAPAKQVLYKEPILISSDVKLTTRTVDKKSNPIVQKLVFNKSTGKKINLLTEVSEKYKGSGAFTLVNGAVNERGLGDSESFLGFEGTDLEAVIDLGSLQKIASVTVYTFGQPGSWIYHPKSIDVQISNDGNSFTKPANITADSAPKENRYTTLKLDAETRFVKVQAKNFGVIPDGYPGSGNRAWLFVDEIQVN